MKFTDKLAQMFNGSYELESDDVMQDGDMAEFSYNGQVVNKAINILVGQTVKFMHDDIENRVQKKGIFKLKVTRHFKDSNEGFDYYMKKLQRNRGK